MKSDVWKSILQANDWSIHGGVLSAARQGAAIMGNLQLPAKCSINISLAWKGVPDFVVLFGSDPEDKNLGQLQSAVRLEVWNRNIVLVRETRNEADLARLIELGDKTNQIELQILLDQQLGLAVVRDVHGRFLGKVKVAAKQDQPLPGLHIINHGPALTVERLQVYRWDGVSMLTQTDLRQVVKRSGASEVDNWIVGYDAQQKRFATQAKDGASSAVDADDLAFGSFGGEVIEGAGEEQDLPEVILATGSRLRGQWLASKEGSMGVRSAWLAEDLRFSPKLLASIVGSSAAHSTASTEHRYGILKTGDSELMGYLVEDSDRAGVECLQWHLSGSQNASSLLPSAQGSINYRLSLSESQIGSANRVSAQTSRINREKGVQPTDLERSATSEILFASGDTIDAIVDRIDESNVYFNSELTKVVRVPQERLDSAWLNPIRGAVKSTKLDHLEELLTVPRIQTNDPPTHLLMAVSGDYLRGRLIKLDKDTLVFEVRGQRTSIPRSQVAQIIWLQPPAPQTAAPSAPPNKPTPETPSPEKPSFEKSAVDAGDYMLHVIQPDRRLTFSPTGIEGNQLRGKSELLGDCVVPIKNVSQLLFGPDLQRSIQDARKNPWTLQLARLPRAFIDFDDSLTGDSTSALIGKIAPNFHLDDLSGQPKTLNHYIGNVLVIDFWASWCAPCMKSLPSLAEHMSGLNSQKASFLAVNLREPEGRVQSVAESLGITERVLLDRNGDVAESYAVQAIPQTVIIDQKGVVRFVFVGGGKASDTSIKEAVQRLLNDPD
jgi:peroxiredoxin